MFDVWIFAGKKWRWLMSINPGDWMVRGPGSTFATVRTFQGLQTEMVASAELDGSLWDEAKAPWFAVGFPTGAFGYLNPKGVWLGDIS